MQLSDVAAWAGILVAGAIGVWGLVQSSRANTHSAEAIELARAADTRATRAEQLQLERRDVSWKYGWDADSTTVQVENIGADIAHNVVLWVDPANEPRLTQELSTVPPRDRIGLRLSTLADEWLANARVNLPNHLRPTINFDLRAGVTWESESGVPGSETWQDVVHVVGPSHDDM